MPQPHEPDPYGTDEHAAEPQQEQADWADLADLGVPNVEPAEPRKRHRGATTAVALLVAACVVVGGVALVSPGISNAFGGKSDGATPTGSASAPQGSTPKASASPTPAKPAPSTPASPSVADAESAPAGPDVSRLADAAWVQRVAKQADIPERALASYAGASIRVQQLRPGCNIGWNTLAAIGNVESHHGSINGNRLSADGTVSPGVYGVALDGSDKVAAIRDTDRGRVDGDATWDRAVGPMQFIPSTWARVKQDGNADGVAEVQQLDDATLSAGLHLCDVGGDLSVPQNWIRAVGA